MPIEHDLFKKLSPVAIGGVGGSGTRLFSQIFTQLGYDFGQDKNEAFDNLSFTLLFKRLDSLNLPESEFNQLVELFINSFFKTNSLTEQQISTLDTIANDNRGYQSYEWLKTRAKHIINFNSTQNIDAKWGWKEPNTHIYLPQLKNTLPKLKYIHVIRNGIDMAFSSNQNQLILWGKHFNPHLNQVNPYHSLKFWCLVHQRLLKYAETMPNDFLLINYDEFCKQPDIGFKVLCEFLAIPIDLITAKNLLQLVRPPQSIGRHKEHDISIFDQIDINYVKELGFEVHP